MAVTGPWAEPGVSEGMRPEPEPGPEKVLGRVLSRGLGQGRGFDASMLRLLDASQRKCNGCFYGQFFNFVPKKLFMKTILQKRLFWQFSTCGTSTVDLR